MSVHESNTLKQINVQFFLIAIISHTCIPVLLCKQSGHAEPSRRQPIVEKPSFIIIDLDGNGKISIKEAKNAGIGEPTFHHAD